MRTDRWVESKSYDSHMICETVLMSPMLHSRIRRNIAVDVANGELESILLLLLKFEKTLTLIIYEYKINIYTKPY
jgi:hypothetical protein